jgi:hypothetical protein
VIGPQIANGNYGTGLQDGNCSVGEFGEDILILKKITPVKKKQMPENA